MLIRCPWCGNDSEHTRTYCNGEYVSSTIKYLDGDRAECTCPVCDGEFRIDFFYEWTLSYEFYSNNDLMEFDPEEYRKSYREQFAKSPTSNIGDELATKYGLPAPENKEQSLADKYGFALFRKKPARQSLNVKSNSAKSIPPDALFTTCQFCGYVFGNHEATFFLNDVELDDCVEDPLYMQEWRTYSAECPYCGHQNKDICAIFEICDIEVTGTLPPSGEKLHAATLATRYGLPEQRQSYDEISDKYGLPAPENKEQSLADKYGISFFNKKLNLKLKNKNKLKLQRRIK